MLWRAGDEAADVKKITVPVPRLMYENDLRIKERKIQRQQNEVGWCFVDRILFIWDGGDYERILNR